VDLILDHPFLSRDARPTAFGLFSAHHCFRHSFLIRPLITLMNLTLPEILYIMYYIEVCVLIKQHMETLLVVVNYTFYLTWMQVSTPPYKIVAFQSAVHKCLFVSVYVQKIWMSKVELRFSYHAKNVSSGSEWTIIKLEVWKFLAIARHTVKLLFGVHLSSTGCWNHDVSEAAYTSISRWKEDNFRNVVVLKTHRQWIRKKRVNTIIKPFYRTFPFVNISWFTRRVSLSTGRTTRLVFCLPVLHLFWDLLQFPIEWDFRFLLRRVWVVAPCRSLPTFQRHAFSWLICYLMLWRL
jgi:hypothetical protein